MKNLLSIILLSLIAISTPLRPSDCPFFDRREMQPIPYKHPSPPDTNVVSTGLFRWLSFSHQFWRRRSQLSLERETERHKPDGGGFDPGIPGPPPPGFPNPPVGNTLIEGLGELADILSTGSSSKAGIRGANALAWCTRLTDVVLGSFPEFLKLEGKLLVQGGMEREYANFGSWWIELNDPKYSALSFSHCALNTANQIDKLFDMGRARDRFKQAKTQAAYNRHMSSKEVHTLRIKKGALLIMLGVGLYIKQVYQKEAMLDRYPYLIAECIISLFRRWWLSSIQKGLWKKAQRFEWQKEHDQAHA